MSTWVYTKTDLFNEIREDLNDGNFFTAVSKIVNHLEAQEAAKPPEPVEPVEWGEGDLVRWEKEEEIAQGRLMRHPTTNDLVSEDLLCIKTCGGHIYRPAAECTLIKRAGE
jgi:hypothetical protein